jgi:hypothetical protein
MKRDAQETVTLLEAALPLAHQIKAQPIALGARASMTVAGSDRVMRVDRLGHRLLLKV